MLLMILKSESATKKPTPAPTTNMKITFGTPSPKATTSVASTFTSGSATVAKSPKINEKKTSTPTFFIVPAVFPTISPIGMIELSVPLKNKTCPTQMIMLEKINLTSKSGSSG